MFKSAFIAKTCSITTMWWFFTPTSSWRRVPFWYYSAWFNLSLVILLGTYECIISRCVVFFVVRPSWRRFIYWRSSSIFFIWNFMSLFSFTSAWWYSTCIPLVEAFDIAGFDCFGISSCFWRFTSASFPDSFLPGDCESLRNDKVIGHRNVFLDETLIFCDEFSKHEKDLHRFFIVVFSCLPASFGTDSERTCSS